MDWQEMQDEGRARGHWATPSEIQNRIKEREQTKSKEALIIFGVVFAGMAILLGLVYYLI